MEGAFVMLKKGWRKRVFRFMPGKSTPKKRRRKSPVCFASFEHSAFEADIEKIGRNKH